jgi:hypothetical protein
LPAQQPIKNIVFYHNLFDENVKQNLIKKPEMPDPWYKGRVSISCWQVQLPGSV